MANIILNLDWDFDELEGLVQDRGDRVIVETGVSCTCRNDDTIASLNQRENAPAPRRRLNCNKCQGDGYIYRNARVVKGLITSIQAGPSRQLIDAGYAVQGDAVFSPAPSAGPLTDFDRVTFLHSTPVSDGQVVYRNAAQLEDNAPIELGLTADEDRLWYLADCVIHCEDEDGRIYAQNADFVIDDKLIRWVGDRPDDNKLYTIKYTAFLEWIVYNTPFERYDRHRSLAQRVLLRKKHVAFLHGSPADTAAKRSEEEAEFTTRTSL
jgi:hypothetical protein